VLAKPATAGAPPSTDIFNELFLDRLIDDVVRFPFTLLEGQISRLDNSG
jgi:hypothetical protein